MPDWRDQWQRKALPVAKDGPRAEALRALGLTNEAHTSDAIKEKYRELAMRWHPDLHDGIQEKAVAEVEFKKVGQAFMQLQGRLPVGHEVVAIDPFRGVPWYHYHRYPPWSFARGPPYAPSGFWCVAPVWARKPLRTLGPGLLCAQVRACGGRHSCLTV